MGDTNITKLQVTCIKDVGTYPSFQRTDLCAGLSQHLPNDLFSIVSQFNLFGIATINLMKITFQKNCPDSLGSCSIWFSAKDDLLYLVLVVVVINDWYAKSRQILPHSNSWVVNSSKFKRILGSLWQGEESDAVTLLMMPNSLLVLKIVFVILS